MSQTQIFWPMITLTFLIYCVYLLLFLRRRRAVMSGQAKISRVHHSNERAGNQRNDDPQPGQSLRSATVVLCRLPVTLCGQRRIISRCGHRLALCRRAVGSYVYSRHDEPASLSAADFRIGLYSQWRSLDHAGNAPSAATSGLSLSHQISQFFF